MLSLYGPLLFTVLYRATINFPELPYSSELRHRGSEEFLRNSKEISDAVNHLLRNVPGDHRASVLQYRYHKSVGTLVSIDLHSATLDARIRKAFDEAIKRGRIGGFAVSPDAYELHVVRAANSTCNPEEFACADGTCIDAKKRCDGHPNCPDHSDERSIYAHCDRHVPIIFQKQKRVTVRQGGEIALSAIVDMLPHDHQVIWSRKGQILGQGSLTVTEDTRIHVYNHHDEYSLHIEQANDKDEGEYLLTVDGLGQEEKFFVSLSNDRLPSETEGCPDGERACKSGHCIPIDQFCDRERQCPDGDDEHNCTTVICSRSELRCAVDNVCVPLSGRCDGWRDCADGTDELACAKTKPVKSPASKSVASRPTVSCPDGSAPEYSLHGSTYCWANAVCPTDTECVHGLCCSTGKTDKRSVLEGESCPDASNFRCENGECIADFKKCDRKYDCLDGSDETKCDYFLAAMKAHHESNTGGNSVRDEPQQTPPPQRQPAHKDFDVESECSDQEFRCPYLVEMKCFHYEKLCDGVDDCGDGSDEINCESGSPEDRAAQPNPPDHRGHCNQGQFQCRDGSCIEEVLKCNRKYDCNDGSDETECDYYKAAMSPHQKTHPNALPESGAKDAELQRREQEVRRREEAEKRREAEERQREQNESKREEENSRREDQRRIEDDLRRRQHEERQRHETERREDERRRADEEARTKAHPEPPKEVRFSGEHEADSLRDEYEDAGCLEHEFMCRTGDCIDKRRLCDTRSDCLDGSDEENCPARRDPQRDQQRDPQRDQPPPPPPPPIPPRLPQQPDIQREMTATEGRVPFRRITEKAPPIGGPGAGSSSDFARKKSVGKRGNLGNEVHPGSSVARRDERIKSVGSSFEEIRESSEEAEIEEPSTSSRSNRSPHALVELAFRRSHSLTQQHSLLSPRGIRRIGVGCLQRGLSEPLLPPRRKNSYGEYSGSLTDRVDSLSLAPIPETATPSSPNHHGEPAFRQESE